MSNKQHKDNSGVLFQNDNAKNPKAPHYKGKATVDGHVYDIAGWKQTSQRDGKPYLSIKFQEPWKKDGGTTESEVDEAF